MPKRNDAYVFIHLDGQWLPCGYLSIEEDNRKIHSTFQYGKKYLQRENAISIDPVQLPLANSLFRSVPKSPLFGGIRDAAPDGWGRHLLDRAAAPLSPGEFEYLTAFAPEDRIGALGFGSSIEHGPGPIDPGWAKYPPHGAELNLAEEEGLKIIDQMKKKFLSEWEQIYLRYNVPHKDLPALAEAFVNHKR